RLHVFRHICLSFTATSTSQLYTLSLHDALPISIRGTVGEFIRATLPEAQARLAAEGVINCFNAAIALHLEQANAVNVKVDSNNEDRKSTRLNSSHVSISYAVFCLKKKIKQ